MWKIIHCFSEIQFYLDVLNVSWQPHEITMLLNHAHAEGKVLDRGNIFGVQFHVSNCPQYWNCSPQSRKCRKSLG